MAETKAEFARETKLERLKLVIMGQLKKDLMDRFALNPQVYLTDLQGFTSDWVSARVIFEVWGKSGNVQKITYPADWREAIKHRFFPHWLRKRFPVKFREVVIQAREIYPSAAFPEFDPQLSLIRKEDGDPPEVVVIRSGRGRNLAFVETTWPNGQKYIDTIEGALERLKNLYHNGTAGEEMTFKIVWLTPEEFNSQAPFYK